jgi:hypothetical protein
MHLVEMTQMLGSRKNPNGKYLLLLNKGSSSRTLRVPYAKMSGGVCLRPFDRYQKFAAHAPYGTGKLVGELQYNHQMLLRKCLSVVLLALTLCAAKGRWHPYEEHPQRPGCEKEIQSHGHVSPAATWGDKRKLWHNVSSSYDEAHGDTMFGFNEEIFEKIWQNQHPANCSEAKFLVSGDWEQGFGSEMHVYGVGLALAINMNRVFIIVPNSMGAIFTDKMGSVNRHHVDNQFCRKQGRENLGCYYEPFTSCSIKDAIPDMDLQGLKDRGLGDISPKDLMANKDRPEKALLVRYDNGGSDLVPDALHRVAQCSPFAIRKQRYWWRSTAAAYMFRPNAPMRDFIAQHRTDPTMAFDHQTEHCVSVYVRRGDKDLEMRILQNEEMFFDAAKRLWAQLEGVEREQPKMFIGSEDAGVIEHAIKWGKQNNWKILYSNLFDRAAVMTGLNATAQAEARRTGKGVHHPLEYAAMMLNLDAHIRCSAFVCTHASNYCRVIDEMRATVAAKAHRPYADFSCPNPPECAFSGDTNIDW